VNDLVKATGLNRGSLYSEYDGKRSLFIKALTHYDQKFRADHLARISASQDAKTAIISAFQDAAGNTGTKDTPAGCLLVNTALEVSPHDPEVAAFVQESFAKVELFFRDSIKSAQADGTLSKQLDASKTAQSLLGLFLGLRVLTRAGGDPKVLSTIIEQAKTMLA
jgi:TetR/AcrR family transcriptional repressor of nem operon